MALSPASQSNFPYKNLISAESLKKIAHIPAQGCGRLVKREVFIIAVRANERRLSELEYENTYFKLYQYLADRIKRIPSRYQQILGMGFNNALNELFDEIIILSSFDVSKRTCADRYRVCQSALIKLEEVIKYSYLFWDLSQKDNGIKYVSSKSRAFWAFRINSEIALIAGVMNKCNKPRNTQEAYIPIIMTPFTQTKIKETIFLEKISTIERTVYRIAAQASKRFQDAALSAILNHSREAFYYAYTGNGIYAADDTTLYKKRVDMFSKAITQLYACERFVRLLYNSSVISGNDLKIVNESIADAIKILKTIRAKESEYIAE